MIGRAAAAAEEGARRLDGDRLDRLFRAEAPRIVRFFERRSIDADEARDLTHEVFVRVAGIETGTRLRNPAAYIQRVARNLLFDRSRRNAVPSSPVHVELAHADAVPTPPRQSEAIEYEETYAAYLRALAGLSARTREVFLLQRRDGYTYREIGVRLGISIGTVEYHMTRALLHLASALEIE